ncbi:MAG: flagellar filament capping protein FliD [Candidatus Thiodiazotropha lotti]|uniref:Flagellar hook-associated protein 2 n=1 Tax=Candidatus Thiodiazotropha lotti TaxID=2792787 RepID=A0A9E4N0I3_9GAMM|nr:flagellar filament capping protein FliD [Candidatus Thiodiazotropha endoloripes]MCG7872279.1 flagellar filament capping protein FliD [Candidatus Thiodiazotropha lotti]MCG7923842.1 flagellar filament capping protein FliD [Candidatus Thiodiazotropha lotti]MCG7931611.1 flagellar filament capping protein FliD [Candidatus Thiodiazotropha lotti]MCG7939931.1 flagellar filament capping protein FliD [Candidatus Thiodiazotropha lotti]MCG7987641.1 flagellar filament capping protein FliD [Candidatus Th
MTIGFSGISTGSDWNSIINQLLQIESRPLTTLQSREKEIDEKISDFGLVKSAIDTFNSTVEELTSSTGFAAFNATSTEEAVLTVSADSSAVPSSYDVVVTQLAERDKIASSAYADAITAVGTGTLSITVDGNTMDLVLDGSNNTLTDIRNAINSATDNPGVTATILNETSGSRLILTSEESGLASAITVSVADGDDASNTDANGLSRLFHIGVGGDGLAEQIDTAQDAILTIDGFSITGASNTVTSAISGVTLSLTGAGSSTINITRDNTEIEERISGFVDAYNTLISKIDELEAGSLYNDSSLRRIKQGFVDVINQTVDIAGDTAYLFEIGITRDRDGVLSVDSSELSTILADDFNRVTQILSEATTGYATRFYNYTESLLQVGGLLDSKNETLNSQKDSVQTQIERQELRLQTFEAKLIEQFAALDQTMAVLTSTSEYLTNQLSSLNNSNN